MQTEKYAHNVAGVFENLRQKIIGAIPDIIVGAAVFFVFLILARIGKRLIASVAPRVRADQSVVLLLSRVYYYGVLTIGLLVALQSAGLNVSALVAGLGLTGFALGFALKDILSNLLSGTMFLFYRPFELGDRVKIGEFEGVIEAIRVRDTVLQADDARRIVVPNVKLITEVVVVNNPDAAKRAGGNVADAPESAGANVSSGVVSPSPAAVSTSAVAPKKAEKPDEWRKELLEESGAGEEKQP